jgi:hypothetical protein
MKQALRFWAPAVVAALVGYRVEAATRAQQSEGDPLMLGPDSPALERFRAYRAEQERIRLGQMERNAIALAVLKPALAAAAALVRRAAEALQRRCGDDAATIIRDAIDQAENTYERTLGAGEGGGPGGPAVVAGPDAAAEAAEPDRVRPRRDRAGRRAAQGRKVQPRRAAVREAAAGGDRDGTVEPGGGPGADAVG